LGHFDIVSRDGARRRRGRFQTLIRRFVRRQFRFGFEPLRANAAHAGQRFDALRPGGADFGLGFTALVVEFGRAQTG
jgi:hypothetical protein